MKNPSETQKDMEVGEGSDNSDDMLRLMYDCLELNGCCLQMKDPSETQKDMEDGEGSDNSDGSPSTPSKEEEKGGKKGEKGGEGAAPGALAMA